MREERKRGKFTLCADLLRVGNFSDLKAIMDKVIVFHTEARLDRDEITYFAYHPSFDSLDYGCEYPKYETIVSTHYGTRGPKTNVEWRKVE